MGFGLVFFQCCAPVSVRQPLSPFGRQEISHILSGLNDRQRQVQTIFSSGRVTLEENNSESDADFLIIGKKDPLRIKVEITHPWGRPLFELVINQERLEILSFPEKRFYLGEVGGIATSSLFPGRLDGAQIWSLVRGCPVVLEHSRATSPKHGEIILLNDKSEIVQTINLHPESLLPGLVSYPDRGTGMLFSDFQRIDGIWYAAKTRWDDPGDKSVLLNTKRMVFNGVIPESIFGLIIPPDFETVPLALEGSR